MHVTQDDLYCKIGMQAVLIDSLTFRVAALEARIKELEPKEGTEDVVGASDSNH